MELGEFRLWCKVAAHAVHKSGIPAEDVLDKVTAHNRPTTHIFHKHEYYENPMAQPPWRCSGDVADMGGEGAVYFGVRVDGPAGANAPATAPAAPATPAVDLGGPGGFGQSGGFRAFGADTFFDGGGADGNDLGGPGGEGDDGGGAESDGDGDGDSDSDDDELLGAAASASQARARPLHVTAQITAHTLAP